MKITVFWGCRIQTSQYAYEMSVREVLPKLDVEIVDLPENVCCGDPVKSVNAFAATYLGARILALANSAGLNDLLVPCNRCHFALSEARRTLQTRPETMEKVTALLKEEGLEYDPKLKIWHTVDFLHDHIGLERVRGAVRKQLKKLRLASHVGCQIIRYTDLGRPEDAENPKKLDSLIGALGAESIEYAEKLDCCGAALMYSHTDSALSLAGSKIKALQGLAVDGLVVSCPDCGLMFDSKQKQAETTVGEKLDLPVLYYTQVLGLAMRLKKEKLGLQLNQSPVDKLLSKIPS